MFKLSRDAWGYIWTGVIVVVLLGGGAAGLWFKAHPGPNPVPEPEWRCTDPEIGEVCERVRQPAQAKAPRKP